MSRRASCWSPCTIEAGACLRIAHAPAVRRIGAALIAGALIGLRRIGEGVLRIAGDLIEVGGSAPDPAAARVSDVFRMDGGVPDVLMGLRPLERAAPRPDIAKAMIETELQEPTTRTKLPSQMM